MTARVYAHGIGGGWEVRHEGCASRCCEAEATLVTADGSALAVDHDVDAFTCGGCGGHIGEPALPMDFDRSQACEQHAKERD